MTNPIPTRELPKGAQVRFLTVDESKVKDVYDIPNHLQEIIVTYKGMDGVYGKFSTEDGDTLTAVGYHKRDGDVRVFCNRDDLYLNNNKDD